MEDLQAVRTEIDIRVIKIMAKIAHDLRHSELLTTIEYANEWCMSMSQKSLMGLVVETSASLLLGKSLHQFTGIPHLSITHLPSVLTLRMFRQPVTEAMQGGQP